MMTASRLLTVSPSGLPEELLCPLRERWDNGEDDGVLEELLGTAAEIGRPKAFYRSAVVGPCGAETEPVENCGETGVMIEGYPFTGPLVAEKLHPGMTVVGYVVTCGRELYEQAARYADDFYAAAVWDDICAAYLRVAGNALHRHMEGTIFPRRDGKRAFASLNPGSLPSWPIECQRELFAFLEDGPALAGVELTPSMLMLPTKSGSGLFFPNTDGYENCERCGRRNCPNRRGRK